MNIKLDVLVVQLIHVGLLFWIFKKLIGDSLVDAIIARKEQIAKLKDAEYAYDRMMAEANHEKEQIIAQAITHKKQLIEEGKQLGEAEKNTIIDAAVREAQALRDQAEMSRQEEKKQLYDQFELMVKQTAAAGIKKLIGTKVDLRQQYLDEVSSWKK